MSAPAGPMAPGSLIRSGIERGTAGWPPVPAPKPGLKTRAKGRRLTQKSIASRKGEQHRKPLPAPGEVLRPGCYTRVCLHREVRTARPCGPRGPAYRSEGGPPLPPPCACRQAHRPLLDSGWSRRWERACRVQGVPLVVGVCARACARAVCAAPHCGPRSLLCTQGRVLCNYRG